jgi:hypothetical protein
MERRIGAIVWLVTFLLVSDLAVVAVRGTAGGRVLIRTRVVDGRTVVVLPPGQAEITGQATSLAADAQDAGNLPSPFTIVVARGAGHASLEGVIVDGRRTTIFWDGGQPFTVTGGIGLHLGVAHVTATPTGVRWALDAHQHTCLAGLYHTTATVAVGAGGLATPRDGLDFFANAQTVLTTSGGAFIGLPPRGLHLLGPGSLALVGRFTVRTAGTTRDATDLGFGPGPFDVTLRPVRGGYSLTAVVRGPLEVRK